MNGREKLYNGITNIREEYIEEAQCKENKNRKLRFIKEHRFFAYICAALLVAVFLFATACAASETFRQAVIKFFYPLYSSEAIKEIDNGHMTGSFDEIDTLLSFLDKFNNDKLEHGLMAKRDNGYTYSLFSNSDNGTTAVVECNIVGYKLLVTLERIAYEDTTGLWQVVSYQIVSQDEADIMLSEYPQYVPKES